MFNFKFRFKFVDHIPLLSNTITAKHKLVYNCNCTHYKITLQYSILPKKDRDKIKRWKEENCKGYWPFEAEPDFILPLLCFLQAIYHLCENKAIQGSTENYTMNME